MTPEIVFQGLMFLAFLALFGIRIYHQRKVLQDGRQIQFRENKISLAAGAIAALTSLVFGLEYVFFQGRFQFAYLWEYPDWLRWLGVGLLAGGIFLLGWSHVHLGRSFHSLVGAKQDHRLVESGPYQWIRHPIYTAYQISYLGGGLLSSNLVLTFVPLLFFSLMIINRIPREEELLREQFGDAYLKLEKRTGRLLPKLSGNNFDLS